MHTWNQKRNSKRRPRDECEINSWNQKNIKIRIFNSTWGRSCCRLRTHWGDNKTQQMLTLICQTDWNVSPDEAWRWQNIPTWTQQEQPSPRLMGWHLTFDGKWSRTNEVPAQLPVCCCLTEHNVTVPAGWMRLSGWSGRHPPWCLPALLLPLGRSVCRAEGCHSARSPVDSGISHVYLAELGWKFITLPWSFDFREVVFVFAASLVCVPHF